MSPAPIDEDSLKPYQVLKGVIEDVMKPTNDTLADLSRSIQAINDKLDNRYYQKEMIDEKLKQLSAEITELKERNFRFLAGASAIVTIISFLVTHFLH